MEGWQKTTATVTDVRKAFRPTRRKRYENQNADRVTTGMWTGGMANSRKTKKGKTPAYTLRAVITH
jgi:hypothetical protein